ncbi:hypothetical protein JCM5353_003230 [Sporobolomyces roseus]
MPTNRDAGFTAAVSYPSLVPQSPSSTPQSSTPVYRTTISPEYGLAHISTTELSCFIHLPTPSLPARIYFTRDLRIVPLDPQAQEPEVYSVFIELNENQEVKERFVKNFATGKGVESDSTKSWFIDGKFGVEPKDLGDLRFAYIQLTICKSRIKYGAPLGDGLLDPGMIAEIDEQNPLCIFKWHFVTKAQLIQLGLLDSPPSPNESSQSLPPPSRLALDFLRRSNQLLISLLTLDQKKRFLEKLMGFEEFEVDDELHVEEPEGRRELSRLMQRLAKVGEGEEKGTGEGAVGEGEVEVKAEEKGEGNEEGEKNGSSTSTGGVERREGTDGTVVTVRRRSLRNKT